MKIRDKGKREKGTKGEVVERKRELVLESEEWRGWREGGIYWGFWGWGGGGEHVCRGRWSIISIGDGGWEH